jgi:ADP-ribose pyrophosphatase
MKQRTDEEMSWKTLDSEYLIKRPWLTARRDKVELPTGKVFDEYYVLEYPTWINVIAITKEGKMILERQYRHALGVVSTEIVAGCVEEGETPLEGARRELKEETGYTGGTWTELMISAPNPGTMTNLCHSFLAEGVELTAQKDWDATEDIEVFLKTKQEVRDMLEQGVFQQAMMIAPLWKYFAQQTK